MRRAEIDDFHWHDLPHTRASWHIQNGTSLYELQKLGGWSSLDMVERYAHLNAETLRNVVESMTGTKLVHAVQSLAQGG